ncbi:MAG: glycosyl transferase family 2, partial [Anaerolineaceae bacterium]
MPSLTLFTAPKPFTDPHIAMIQRNALHSWKQLGEEAEILLVGDETGMAEIAAELQLKHNPQVKCNSQGTPLVSSIFELARRYSESPLLAYLNADILI